MQINPLAATIKVMRLLVVLAVLVPGQLQAKDFTLIDASIIDIQSALEKGQLTSVELVEQYLARIEAYDQQNASLNALIRLNPRALERAGQLDLERKNGLQRGPMHGIPIIIKDNFNTHDMPTSSGSIALAGFRPASDAAQLAKLRKAGAILLAKANMDEFATGGSGLSSLGGQTKNPYDPSRNPGGSSGGTAVAIAANYAVVGMGTDTCGSIRVPSSFNNLVGLRPSKGLSDTTGIVPFYYFSDVGGPMARTVRDVAITMDVLTDNAPRETTTKKKTNDLNSGFVNNLESIDIATLRIGKLVKHFSGDESNQVDKTIAAALDKLAAQGVTFVDIDTALFDALIGQLLSDPVYEFKGGMADYFQRYPGSGFKVPVDFIQPGLYHQSLDNYWPFLKTAHSDITEAQSLSKATWAELVRKSIKQIMVDHDLDTLLYPTAKYIPNKIGDSPRGRNCTLSAASGTPALALPVGFSQSGLPIGIDLLSEPLSDERLLAIGYAIESILKPRKPPLSTPALVDARAPTPKETTLNIDSIASVFFRLDVSQHRLQYQTQYFSDEEIYAICLHSSKQGPVIDCVSGIERRRSSGSILLSYEQINALQNGDIYLRVFSPKDPKGQNSTPLLF